MSTSTHLNYGVSLPPHGEYGDPVLLVKLAQEAEAAGWDGFFIWDHLLFDTNFRGPIVDAWTTLAAVAAKTAIIKLGPMVTPLARRRPWKVAREALTLDLLSGGRLILGVGLGYPADCEFTVFGEESSERTRAGRLDEGLDVLSGLLTGRPFSYDGHHYQIRECTFLPTPVQQPRIPIWVGGYWPNRPPFRRAARWDGVFPGRLTLERRAQWSPTMLTPSDVQAMVDYVTAHRVGDSHFDVAIGGYTSGTDRKADAMLLRTYMPTGMTWFIENLHGYRGSLSVMRDRLLRGPPCVV